jgi:hypothetical protein
MPDEARTIGQKGDDRRTDSDPSWFRTRKWVARLELRRNLGGGSPHWTISAIGSSAKLRKQAYL